MEHGYNTNFKVLDNFHNCILLGLVSVDSSFPWELVTFFCSFVCLFVCFLIGLFSRLSESYVLRFFFHKILWRTLVLFYFSRQSTWWCPDCKFYFPFWFQCHFTSQNFCCASLVCYTHIQHGGEPETCLNSYTKLGITFSSTLFLGISPTLWVPGAHLSRKTDFSLRVFVLLCCLAVLHAWSLL